MTAKLKAYPYQDGFEICGNREGLKELAEISLALSEFPENADAAKSLGNHYHFADYMDNAEAGSTPFIILYKPDL